MRIEILDPTHEDAVREFVLAPRLETLAGATIGILSNGKKGSKPFFDALERELIAQHGVGEVVRLTKANYSAPGEPALFDQAQRWHALIAGVGD